MPASLALVIANPGGLYGAVTEDDLGREGVTSSRNPALIKVLQDTRLTDSDRTVCENRGSGIPAMLRDLRQAHAAPPEFHNRISRFTVTFRRSQAVPEQPVLAGVPVLPRGETANLSLLEHMPVGEELSRQEIQDLTGRSQVAVVRHLNDLIRTGLVEATAPPRSPHRRYRRLR